MRRPVWGRQRSFRGFAGTVIVLAAIAALAVVATWLTPMGKPLTGRPAVVDGDTLRFGSTRVRLTGIDAPELDQTCLDANGASYACGAEAKTFLASLVRGGETRCDRSGRDRYGRMLASCSAGPGDLGAAIANAGWAVAEEDYAVPALAARAAARGIWQGRFEDPAEWRRDHGAPEPGWWEWIRSLFQ